MNITRTAAIAVFAALGFKTADKWNTARLNEKVAKIADNVTDKEVEAIEDKEIKSTVMDVIDDLKAGKTVTVTEDEPAKSEAKSEEKPAAKADEKPAKEEKPSKPAKEEKPAKSEKPKADKPKAKKEEPAKDKFGNRVGSQAADINAAIGTGWATEEEVCKATKLKPARVQNHFRYLESKKLLETDEKKGVRFKK